MSDPGAGAVESEPTRDRGQGLAASPRPRVLVVDLSASPLETASDFYDAIAGPLGLLSWFGRNLDALWDALTGGISATVDEASRIEFICPRSARLFETAPGQALRDMLTNAEGKATLKLV